MEIIEKKENGVCILSLVGRLDPTTSPQFKDKIFEVLGEGTTSVVLDLEKLNYLSSAGLRVLLEAKKEITKSGGEIVLCSVREYIKEVFDVTGFDSLFPIASDVEKALEKV
jgi:anti-anti-sigma factor